MRFVNYGNSEQWNTGGLGVLGIFVAIAVGFTIYLAFVLEIFKTRAVRLRNAGAHLTVVPPVIDAPETSSVVDTPTDDDRGSFLGEGHDRAAGIATDPRDD